MRKICSRYCKLAAFVNKLCKQSRLILFSIYLKILFPFQLPKSLKESLKKAGKNGEIVPHSEAGITAIKKAISDSYLAVNRELRTNPRIDDSLSGTTAISVLFIGGSMYISNVGDSRAIIISEDPTGKLVAKALSSDQTPYRKCERERCKTKGARILSMDQIEGSEPVHENWGELTLGEDIDEGENIPFKIMKSTY